MYDFVKGLSRIQGILATKPIPEEKKLTKGLLTQLTYYNGFYVECIALFIDIRGSSTLTDEHRRTTVAKVYRAFISEVLQVIKYYEPAHTDIVGDCVSGYFAGDTTKQINQIFDCAVAINSTIKLLNAELKKKGITEINAGMGLSEGKILLIKAGTHGNNIHSDNDIVWIGDAVNEASKLSDGVNIIKMSQNFYNNLDDDNKKYCQSSWHNNKGIYESTANFNAINSLIG